MIPMRSREGAAPEAAWPAAPTAENERKWELDALRGIALFGILWINLRGFAEPMIYLDLLNESTPVSGWWNEAVRRLADTLVQGKFYTLFSFLFGYGFILFMERAKKRGAKARLLFLRRMIILLVIGIGHAVFIWWGDVLVTYALCGLVLLLFYKAKPRAMVWWAVGCWAAYAAMLSLSYGLAIFAESLDPGSWSTAMTATIENYRTNIEMSYAAYGEGGYREAMAQRLQDLSIYIGNLPFTMLIVLPMFLLGAAAASSGALERARHDARWLRNAALLMLLTGAAWTALKMWGKAGTHILVPSANDILYILGSTFGDPALSLFYVCVIVWICFRNGIGAAFLRPIAAAGRLGITNYLLQSLICTTLFYGYGFGLYGQTGPGWQLFIAVVVYALQVLYSTAYLRKWNYGPVEWLWRSLTYGHVVKMKKG